MRRPVRVARRAARGRGRRRWRPAAHRGRGRRRAPRPRASAARPRRISSGSQRARSWSSSRIGSPSGPIRARDRDAWISISATRPCTSGSCGRELGEDAAEAQRFVAEGGPHPVVAGGGGIALVEDQVDDLEHRRERGVALRAARHFEGDLRIGQRALGAHDALRDRSARGRGRRARSRRRQSTDSRRVSATRASVEQHRVTGGEDQPQQIVADVVVERRLEIGRVGSCGPRLASELARTCAR